MNLSDIFRDRLRSALAILGVAIGVFGVVATTCIGLGARSTMQQMAGVFSSRSFWVIVSPGDSAALAPSISPGQIEHVRTMSNIASFIAFRLQPVIARVGGRELRLKVQGEAPSQFVTESVSTGRNIEGADVAAAANVAVITARGAHRLNSAALGSVEIAGVKYRVVGVLKNSFQSAFDTFGPPTGDIYIPYTTFERRFKPTEDVFSAHAVVVDSMKLRPTIDAVNEYLKVSSDGLNSYKSVSKEDLNNQFLHINLALDVAMFMMALLSGIVAVIGLASTMVIIVSSRKSEFAVRRAIGASRRAITGLVLRDALFLSFVGSLIGFSMGIILANVVNNEMARSATGVSAKVDWLFVGLAALVTGVSIAVGSALLPALRAARLDPLDALRAE
jgi:putative ABC transport system permease protein